ncbi:GntR family transcriptional regulator [Paraburkholderia sp. RP-4-7]|uniref:GntR family transcriptional regulator n=1 Tax=Paraburkholderia polaris TaxID=2728848 RepID=A0A848I5Q1_9BURK|nr:GntR family transcriptional regulator [Paraburkholderia polaris]NML97707.1 GntR family transcriptional regulator [Paraburkholderia polaris]
MSDEVAKETKLPRRTALKQTTLSETVYQEIRTRLQRGEIEPNDRVLDYEVAEEFDCTRMPVRQALLRLVNEGYLVGTTRGFVVPTLTSSDIREIFEMRRLLEPSAAAGAAANLTEKQEAALNRAYRKACKAYDKNDTVTLIDANIEFRDVWLDAVQNARLQSMIRRFADHVQQVRLSTLKNRSTHKIVIDGMQVLLDGFTKRDPKKINAAMLEFIANAEEQYFALLGGED